MMVAIGAALAMAWVVVDAESYFRVAHALSFGVNDIGMAFFFALVTKEVVEATVPGGALHTWRRLLLPVVGAVGGVIGSALVYGLYLHMGDEWSVLQRGWLVAGASDISLGYFVARFVGRKNPAIPFLLLLGISINTLSLVIVEISHPFADVHSGGALLVTGGIAASFFLRRRRIQSFWPYLLLGGTLSWAGFYVSGFHPALALVPIIPFLPHATRDPGLFVETPPGFRNALSRFEYAWKYPVEAALFFFGLVNGGVLLQGSGTGTWSVLVAALVGKPVGILVAILLAIKAGLDLPARVDGRDLIVVALLASVGFTYSLFLATATLPTGPVLDEVKLGALLTFTGALLAVGAARALGVGRFGR